MTAASGLHQLRQLASFHGVQGAYYGVDAHRRSASADSLLAALRALGCGVETPGDASAALRERRQQLARLPVETVTVAWDGNLLELPVRLPRNLASASWWCRLTLESGEQRCLSFPGADLPVSESTEAEGIDYLVKQIPLQVELPLGYHRLTLEIPGLPEAQTLVISAATQAYRPQEPGKTHTWGAFLPLYSLHSNKKTSPSGDFSDLDALLDWVGNLGGSFAGTLPILTSFLRQPLEPSPYAPVSRLLSNEFYVDLARAPELPDCPEARALLDAGSYIGEVQQMRRSPLVDYSQEAELKRRVLLQLARYAFHDQGVRARDLAGYLKQHPEAEDYARFRATVERRGET